MNGQSTKHNHLPRRLLWTAFAAVLVAAAVLLCGCSADKGISLYKESITLTVGETRDIAPYVDFSAAADDRAISLHASSDCVSVSGSKVTAVEEGEATLTVKCGTSSASMHVAVVYPGAAGLTLASDGDAEQTVALGAKPKTVKITAVAENVTDRSPSWSVNGAEQDLDGYEFEFAPPTYGEYTVRAELDGYSSDIVVRVYRPTVTQVEVDGELDQGGDHSPVKFTAKQNINYLNPPSVYEWSVNGDAVSRDSAVFEFVPSGAGSYKIALKVNGAAQKISGSDFVTVTAAPRAPVGEVVFDDADGVYITWKDGGYVDRITIISPNGVRKDVERSDAQTEYLFDGGYFDASDYIEVFAQTPAEYTIRITADETSEFTFMQYPTEASEYCDKTILCHNSFISGANDGAVWIGELYACGVTGRVKCYIGRGADSAETVTGAMRDQAQTLGVPVTLSQSGNVVTVDIGEFVNAPTYFAEVGDVSRMYTTLPHIEYSRAKRRPSSYVLPLDRQRYGVSVTGSEQLLYVANAGIRPIPVAGSTASAIYTAARSTLISIIGADYTDAQKVHAIYDWLQWVCVKSSDNGEESSGRFLEGVFGSSELSAESRIRYSVTSEGAAKAFALMCAVENIPCIIQAFYNSGSLYYWNKVKISGLWYNVDVFSGKADSAELGIARQSEFSTHRALLISDTAAARLGLVALGGEYEAFDESMTVYLDKNYSDGVYYDRYIDSSEKSDYAAIKAAVFGAFDECIVGSVSIPTVGIAGNYNNRTLGVELRMDNTLSSADRNAVIELIRRAVVEYARAQGKEIDPSRDVQIYPKDDVGDNIYVTTAALNAVTTEGSKT